MSLLQATHLTLRAGSATLVDDVTFALAPGERVGLVGESGSGKSMTALAALGLLPDAVTATGSARLDGREVVGAADAAVRRLRGTVAGIVFQEPLTALDPLMRVGRQIAEPLRRHRGLRGAALREEVARALADVSLEGDRIARAYPHELSGGQRQRVAIAIALAADPQLLIADEPTTALDVTVQDEVLTLLERLVADRGMGLLFISHDLAVVSRMVDRVLVLQHGHVVEEGAVRRVLGAPRHPYTRTLVDSARFLDAALDVGAGSPGAESDRRREGR
ncbi:ABC transporter ATP-binding protein [Microbacterium xanthum]|uniref:ABC transporter ATP-binding protein n=1 Tax=Microbacterium xanthum TaxID=3079794 RepID=UPI002AD2C222|nr:MULTISPECIES: ABC transporter ATP-binding protein [unclassified Microbacterium]MDZ8173190.1 ABC transporter ATP-binding protein [Microbacterium sp. KSW-48]MDZ8200657.1 ABC transporter ATP-binding protein [Microbacterium sp. SSW1-59]